MNQFKLAILISSFFIVNIAFGALQSEIFKYPNPKIIKNIHITLRGKTKSGKKWIALSSNQLSTIHNIDPISEMKKLPKTSIAGENLNLLTLAEMKKYIQNWNKNFEEGYPYGGLFIYTDDNPKDRKLIGLIIIGISEQKSTDLQFSMIMMPEYQTEKNTYQQNGYGQNTDDQSNNSYRNSILEKILEYTKEISDIGSNPQKYIISEPNSTSNDKVKSQILAHFSFKDTDPNGKIITYPLLGMCSTCNLEDNWLQQHMKPYPYKTLPHIIADFRMDPLGYEETITQKEFLQIISGILPKDGMQYSIYMPTGELLTIMSKNNHIKTVYFYETYIDRNMNPRPIIVRPLSSPFKR